MMVYARYMLYNSLYNININVDIDTTITIDIDVDIDIDIDIVHTVHCNIQYHTIMKLEPIHENCGCPPHLTMKSCFKGEFCTKSVLRQWRKRAADCRPRDGKTSR